METLDGPVLVLAGAGTGKTRVLTTRIAHILNLGRARPGDILAVTFTNKAAREMKQRVGQMVGQVVEGMPWLGTFHSIGVKILRRHAELVGLKSDFTILDVDDQIRLIKQMLEAEKLDEKRWPARSSPPILDGWKNRGLTPDQVPAGEAASFANGKGKKLYIAYQERLKTLNAADFGDLLLECIRLFRQNPDVLRQYQQRFKFILVDEYQDTNVAQYLWLRLLAQPAAIATSARFTLSPRGRGCAERRRSSSEGGRGVSMSANSDPLPWRRLRFAPARHPLPQGRGARASRAECQCANRRAPSPGSQRRRCSPPSPRTRGGRGSRQRPRRRKTSAASAMTISRSMDGAGAEVDNILRFEHDFPAPRSLAGAKLPKHRPHPRRRSHLIAHNEGRLGKTLRTEDVPGEKVEVTGAWD